MAYRSLNHRGGYVRSAAKIASIRESVVGKCEFDSHADTCVFGKNFVVISYTGRLCDVSPYSDTYDAMVGVAIVSAATLYTDVQTGFEYVLVVNEALHMPDLPYSLLSPNQICYAGNQVFDNPFDHENGVQMNVLGLYHDSVEVLLQFEGTMLSFTSRTPTVEELDVLPHLPLTLTAEWNPHTVRLSSLCVAEDVTPSSVELNDAVEDVSCLYSKTDLSTRLLSQIRVHSHPKDLPDTQGVQADDRHLAKTADELSNL
jgi:hypothetical protein